MKWRTCTCGRCSALVWATSARGFRWLSSNSQTRINNTHQRKINKMKNIKITFAIVMAVIAISIIGLVPVTAATANPFGPGQPSLVLTSAGTTNGPNAALNTVTNGLYPQAIGSAITTNNLVTVQCSAPAAMFGGGGSPNGVLVGNSLALQFSA